MDQRMIKFQTTGFFSSRENDVQKLWNKGECLVENGKHFNFDDIQSNYRKTIKNLQEKL